MTHDPMIFPNGIRLLQSWQKGETHSQDPLKQIYQDAIDGKYDTILADPGPSDAIHIGGAHDMLPLSILYDLFDLHSDAIYKGDPDRYVRSYLISRKLLGLNKPYLSWPCYALTAEAIGQETMYTDKFPPGSDPDVMLLDRENWKSVMPVKLDDGIPAVIEQMLRTYVGITGLEPILHLSAPYSLAADTFGQEPLLGELVHDPAFVVELLHHLADTIHRPWIKDFITKFPNGWIELSDASGSPFFIGPKNCKDISSGAVRYLAEGESWGDRVYVANYRGDYVTQAQRRNRRNARKSALKANAEPTVTLGNLSDAKGSVCPAYVQRLHDDQVPIDFYRDWAIERRVPLYAGIGASYLDRNSISDMDAKLSEVRENTKRDVEAITTVARAIRDQGFTNRKPPWPGTLYFEDVSAETSMELIEVIIETALKHSRY